MTVIEIDKENLKLRLQGHAGYSSVGADIVCAAVSILSFALEAAIDADEGIYYESRRDRVNAVFALECFPEESKREACENMMSVALAGYKLLSMEYPHHVCVFETDLAEY